MKFIPYYSSSKGNLYEVRSRSGNRLIIECGVRWDRILKAFNWDLTRISGCLISHSHKDHSREAARVVQAGIDVYASPDTLEAAGLKNRRGTWAVNDQTLITRTEGFQVYCFDVHHDCPGALGFIVRELETDEFLLFATDTSHLSQRFTYAFNIIAIECSYDQAILETQVALGQINETVAKRLRTSHMEKSTTLKYLKDICNLTACTEIHLMHMSGDRIDKPATRREFEQDLFIDVH